VPGRFLADPRVDEAIDTLARSGQLTVFVGAGASMEVGLPSWPALINRLLDGVARDRGLNDSEASEFIAAITAEADGVIGAATVIRAHFSSSEFRGNADEFIRRSLYLDPLSDDLVEPPFGPTARAVAKLIRLWPIGAVEIVTTNYDFLLERAADEGLHADGSAPTGARAGQGGPQIEGGRFTVRHLHGALGPGDGESDLKPIVIAEADYHLLQGDDAWQRELMITRLRESNCIFVGASMTDVNVLRFLRLARDEGPTTHRHFALLTRPPQDSPSAAKVTAALRAAAQARWAEYGVEVLYPDYFLETSQFLEELARRRQAGNAGRLLDRPEDRYQQRLGSWQDAMERTALPRRPLERFVDAQDRANHALGEWLVELVNAMPGRLRASCTRETFGLQLWIAQDKGDSLLLWAQSTNSWRDPRVLEPIPAKLPSQWGAVQAYCAGSPVLQELAATIGSRWRSALNVPIYLDDEQWGRLPVGVLGLSAMHRHGAAILTTLDRAERDTIVNIMAAAATEYLTPNA